MNPFFIGEIKNYRKAIGENGRREIISETVSDRRIQRVNLTPRKPARVGLNCS